MYRLLFLFILISALPAAAQSENSNVRPATNTVNSTNSNQNYSIPDTTRLEFYKLEEMEETEVTKEISTKASRADKKQLEKNNSTDLQQSSVSIPISDTPASSSLMMQQQFESNQVNSSRQYSRRSASPIEQMNMDQSVQYYQAVQPESFETHFYTYLAGHYNVDLYPELEAAALLAPENTEVKKQEAAYFIINSETPAALVKIGELVEENIITKGQLAYANDLLVSGQETNAIIVTHGFEDMLSAYYVQNQLGVRPDVQLLSLDFMQSEKYRSDRAGEGLVLPESEVIDTAYLANLCASNADRNLQLSLTLPKDYLLGMKEKLYPVGLTFMYSETPVDNFSENSDLWYSSMKKELVSKPMNDSGDKWSANYLPMIVTLRKQLVLLNETGKVKELDKIILDLGARNNAKEKVKKYTY